jgi:hypothetical protein
MDVAGYRLTGDTGSALVGRAGETGFCFWAFEAEKARAQPLPKAIEGEGYRVLQKVGEITLFSDGIRLAWQTQGLYVWLEGGPTDSLDDLPDEAVRTIVSASANVPYPYRAPGSPESPVATESSPSVVTPEGGDGSVLGAAPEFFLQACRETAKEVGYPVPCPSKILAGGSPPPEVTPCHIGLIGAAGLGRGAHSWRGWGGRFHADNSAPSRAAGLA